MSKNHFTTAIFLLFVLCYSTVQSQDHELGNVTIAELEQKKHPTDPSAVACYLFKTGETFMNYTGERFELVTKINYKIKVYSKDGYKYATATFPYYTAKENERVKISKAITYNLVNGKIEKTKLKNEGIFDEDKNENYHIKKMTLPNVKEGAVLEFCVELITPFYYNFPDWIFQEKIPCDYTEFTTRIPEYFRYNPHFKGLLTPETKAEKAYGSYKYYIRNDLAKNNKTYTETNTVNFAEYRTTYILRNVPPLKTEPFSINPNNFRCQIKHELASSQMPDEPIHHYSTSWDGVAETMFNHADFGQQIRSTSFVKETVAALKNQFPAALDGLFGLFNFVQNEITWNGDQAVLCQNNLKKTLETKTGNSAEVNLLLYAMLKEAGYDAHPVLISTRDHGIPLFPSITAFNHVIVVVYDGEKSYLMDATSPISLPNLLPLEDLNWNGLLLKKRNESVVISLDLNQMSTTRYTGLFSINEAGKIIGKTKAVYADYDAYSFRSKYKGQNQDDYLAAYEKHFNQIEIGEYKLENKDHLSQPIEETFEITDKNSIDQIGDQLFVRPLLFFPPESNLFVSPTRELPIEFPYPGEKRIMFTLNIPQNYTIEKLPEPVSVRTAKGEVVFTFQIARRENQIQVVYRYQVTTAILAPEYYEDLKGVLDRIAKKLDEKIVLQKIK